MAPAPTLPFSPFQAYSVTKLRIATCNPFDLSLYPIALSDSSNSFISFGGVEKLNLLTLAKHAAPPI